MAVEFAPEPPPAGVPDDQAAWLMRQFEQLQSSLETRLDLDSDYLYPEKQLDGMLRYSPGGTTDFPVPGMYYRANGEWRVLSTSKWVSETFTFSAYGGMGISSPPITPAWDITSAWQTLDFFDQTLPAVPKHITVNLVNNSLAFEFPGIYVLSVIGSFEHDSMNSGRITYLRAYNMTDGVPVGNNLAVGIGRNVEATSYSALALLDIDSSSTNKELQIQMGGGDNVTVDNFLGTQANAWNIGEWQG